LAVEAAATRTKSPTQAKYIKGSDQSAQADFVFVGAILIAGFKDEFMGFQDFC
jgi:hypothetical protein